MQSIQFSDNPNGKLLNEIFTDIRIVKDKHKIGNLLLLEYKGKSLGIIEVVSTRSFSYSRLNDNMSFSCSGSSAPYFAKMLHSFYNNLKPDTILQHIVFRYYQRNIELHEYLLTEWWKEIKDRNRPLFCTGENNK